MRDEWSRRDVLRAAVGATAACAGVSQLACGSPAAAPAAIDTHTHFYDPTRPEGVPWPAKDTPLYRRVLPLDWLAQAEPVGITQTVVVEASAWVEDNQWLLDVARDAPCLIGVVGRLPIGEEGCTQLIDRFATQPKFRGVRVSGTAVAEGLESTAFMRDIERLAFHNLVPDINNGPVLEAADRLAARLPEMRVILEHMAGARIIGDTPDPAWADGLARAAERPNVWLKVSNLVESAAHAAGLKRAPTDPDVYRPWLDVVWKAFGPDRLIYGSNWPVCERAADYATVVGIVRPWMTTHGQAAEASFFQGAARVAYGLPTHSMKGP
ncbi:MAG: amidohydrolase family protein [Planctomycetota bacterium]|nr:amidohydrolase family protein [Planctomycetota bacterium]